MPDDLKIDSSLLDRVRTGEESAWAELIDLLTPQVLRIIRRQIRTVRDHDDVAQEAFTKIFLHLHQFAERQDFRHWVSRLTINTCYDWLRKKKCRPLASYSDLGQQEAEIIERTLTNEITETDDQLDLIRETLDRLIATLKPREQIVIRLLDLEEHSVKEVGELTGWGASKIKVTAMRARRKLGELLKKQSS